MLETLIFKLSPILGGRSEVLETPLYEALGILELSKRSEAQKRLDDYYNLYFANPMIEVKHRKEYLKKIIPAHSRPKKKLEKDTNLELLKQLKAEMEGGR